MIEEEKQLENHEASTAETQDSSEELVIKATPVEGMNQAVVSEPKISVEEPEAVISPLEDSGSSTPQSLVDQEALVQLAQEAESLRAQLEERENQFRRIAADFDNFRKRVQKEKEDLDQQAKRNTLSELLPVVDSFERARSHLKPQTDQEAAIHKSYQGIYKQLVDCFKRIGVAPMRPEGKPFDPNLHEAVLQEETDEYPEGTVIEELVRGYLLGDRVLRHSMVKVAAVPELTADAESDEAE